MNLLCQSVVAEINWYPMIIKSNILVIEHIKFKMNNQVLTIIFLWVYSAINMRRNFDWISYYNTNPNHCLEIYVGVTKCNHWSVKRTNFNQLTRPTNLIYCETNFWLFLLFRKSFSICFKSVSAWKKHGFWIMSM